MPLPSVHVPRRFRESLHIPSTIIFKFTLILDGICNAKELSFSYGDCWQSVVTQQLSRIFSSAYSHLLPCLWAKDAFGPNGARTKDEKTNYICSRVKSLDKWEETREKKIRRGSCCCGRTEHPFDLTALPSSDPSSNVRRKPAANINLHPL